MLFDQYGHTQSSCNCTILALTFKYKLSFYSYTVSIVCPSVYKRSKDHMHFQDEIIPKLQIPLTKFKSIICTTHKVQFNKTFPKASFGEGNSSSFKLRTTHWKKKYIEIYYKNIQKILSCCMYGIKNIYFMYIPNYSSVCLRLKH